MTVICYDTEFIEDGRTIDLISIGMVAEDGRELYLVNGNQLIISRAYEHVWLRANVIPSLPVRASGIGAFWEWDKVHPDWLAINRRETIAASVRDFILAVPDPQLWADYCAYDHVVLCQLWGSMIDLPEGIPMWTHDLRQEAERLGNPELPPLPGVTEHNALSDAREVAFRLRWLRDREAAR
jgi:hypothetical protein